MSNNRKTHLARLFNFFTILILVFSLSLGGVRRAEALPDSSPLLQTFDCSPTNQTQIPQSECEALVALYNSTDGANWTFIPNYWLTSPMPDDWNGVRVVNGHVEEIYLGNKNLTGTIPTEIEYLTELKILYLWDNQLSGEMPTSIMNLANLVELAYDCSVTSSDPAVIAFLDIKGQSIGYSCSYIDPTIGADNWVTVSGWPSGTPVFTLTVNDPNTPETPDFSIVRPPDVNSTGFYYGFGEGYLIKSGDVISVSGGGFSKDAVVADIAVTSVDINIDKVYGTAGPGIPRVWVRSWSTPEFRSRWGTVQANGSWSVDYSMMGTDPEDVPGDNETWDIGRGDNGIVRLTDTEGNTTRYYWEVPNPRFHVQIVQNNVEGYDWESGLPVTLTIDDPDNGAGVDFTVMEPVAPYPQNPGRGWVLFDDLGENVLVPGMFITMTNGDVTKTHTVTNLMVTSVDVNEDTVSGTGTPGANVSAQYCDLANGCAWRRWAMVQPDGNWSVDFSVTGLGFDEQEILDVLPMTDGEALQPDGDGDHTDYAWFNPPQPEPTIVARLTQNEVDSSNWSSGTLLSLTIDDPLTGLSPDYSGTGISQLNNPQDPGGGTSFNFYFGEVYTLKPGDIVTVEGDGVTRTTTVADIAVTNIDVAGNIISGTAGSGISSVNLRVWGIPFEMQRDAVVVNGEWSADFSVASLEFGAYDIKPGDAGVVRWFEGDGDFTTNFWRAPNPTFAAFVNAEFIEGYEWPLDATVMLEIEDPSTPLSPDFSDSTVVAAADWDPSQTWFNFQLEAYDLKTDDIVKLSANGIEKQLAVMDLTITDVDFLADTVHGTADPNQPVSVSVCGDNFCIFRDEVADSSGDWSANFAMPAPGNGSEDTVDIRSGTWINAFIWDEDGDNTSFGLTAEPPQCQPGTSISGTVFEHDGVTPVPNGSVQIQNFTSGEVLFTTVTDANGLYGCSLPPGSYKAFTWPSDGYSAEYYLEAADDNALELQVSSGTQLSGIDFTVSPLPAVEHFDFNLQNPLLQDQAVREAIALGTNRNQILTGAFLPNNIFGTVLNSIVPPEHWASAPASELELIPFDPAQARAVLAGAGWVDTDNDNIREKQDVELSFTFKTTQAAFRVASAEVFRQNMADIGILITVETMNAGAFFNDGGVLDQRNFDIAQYAWVGGSDNEPYLLENRTGHPSNIAGYSNPAYDTALANARAEGSDSGKLPYLYEAQALLTQDLPILPLFTRYSVAPVATDTGTDVTVSPENYLDITFDEVTNGGVTTVLPLDINPSDLPPNFQLLGQVYEIGTSASFTSAQVCFRYDDAGLTAAQEGSIQLLHLENGSWVDVTNDGYPDTTNNIVCGAVTSFSPFAIVYSNDSTPPSITWIGEIEDGEAFYFGFVPPAPTCTASDGESGVKGECTVTGYGSFVGQHTQTATASDNAGNTTIETRTYTVLAWRLNGFYQPVDMDGVYNLVKNGSTVPLKFTMFAGSTELTDPILIQSLTYSQTSCDSIAITDEIEAVATGGTSLRYDTATGQFIYNWKTPRITGNCYRLTLKTVDGSTMTAYFKLK